MDTIKTCSGCHKPLPADGPDGLCPECLLKAGLGTGVDMGPDSQTDSRRTPFVAPSLEEVARLFPQVEILGFIGQGGMGAVYRARQKALDRVVALKILPPGIGKNPAFAERFTREAKALARLNHPGVVTIYEFGQADGLFFFLMEFVDGMSLRHLLEVERIAPREALAIVPQICDALQYAHDQGIVHRDIKPENILLDRQGRVKVADFGLAKLAEMDAGRLPLTPSLSPSRGEGAPALTDAGKVMGTPQYMAPEQREHPTDVDHRADIYSLGVVFYQMLTGELPGKPIEPPSRKVHIDVRLDEVVLRALEKEPQRRYQQVSQVRTAVEIIATTPPARSGSAPAPPADASHTDAQGSAGTISPWCRIIDAAFGITFTSSLAIKLVNISALGFLGALAFLGFLPLPGMHRCFGFAGFCGFFGLIRVASIIERSSRRKGGGSAASQVKTAVETIATSRQEARSSTGETGLASGASGVEGIRREVKGPAIGLLATAILNWILIPLIYFTIEWPHLFSKSSSPDVTLPLLMLTAFGLSAFILHAALKMMRLEARGAALVASVLAIIVTPGNIIGLPLGIWALVVLNRRDVRAAFAGDKTALAYVLHPAARRRAVWPWILATVGTVLLVPTVLLALFLFLRDSARVEAVRRGARDAKEVRLVAVRSQSRARLPQGEVELVAISFHPSTNQLWWRPDGSPAPEGPFTSPDGQRELGGQMAREFVIRTKGLPEGASLPTWRFDPSAAWGGGGTPTINGQPAKGYHLTTAWLPERARTINVNVGVALGPWETILEKEASDSTRTSTVRGGITWRVSFLEPVERADHSTVVNVVYPFVERQTDVVAVDNEGQEHRSSHTEISVKGIVDVLHLTATFSNLPPSQIKQFRFQARPYEWVEFRDVVLDPNEPLAGGGVKALVPVSGGTAEALSLQAPLAGTVSPNCIVEVRNGARKTYIRAELDEAHELRLFIGSEAVGWSTRWSGSTSVTATVEASDQIKLVDGSMGHGLIFQAWGNRHNIAITPDGPVPYGEVVFRKDSRITNENGTFTFADIRQTNGTLIPVSIRVRSVTVNAVGGNSASEAARLKLQQAQVEFSRIRELYDRKLVSKSQYEAAQGARDLAEAELSGDAAATARAQLQLARQEFLRAEDLFKARLISQAEFEKAKAALDAAEVGFGMTGSRGFGPVIERTVDEAVSGKSAIDLDTGTLQSGPDRLNDAKALHDWMNATGVDALGMISSATHGLGGFDMIAMPVENAQWNISVRELEQTLAMGKPGSPVEMSGKGELPATYLFKTREGGMGVLQIVGFTNNPSGVKIRYKLVQVADSAPPAARLKPAWPSSRLGLMAFLLARLPLARKSA